MRADEDVDLSVLEVGEDLLLVSCAAETVDVVHTHRKAFHPCREALRMLQCKDRGGYEYGHLLAIAHRLERGADRDLRFTEADIAAHESVHRCGLLHVALHIDGRRFLIGCVLVDEAGLEFVLQVVVRLEREARECSFVSRTA